MLKACLLFMDIMVVAEVVVPVGRGAGQGQGRSGQPGLRGRGIVWLLRPASMAL